MKKKKSTIQIVFFISLWPRFLQSLLYGFARFGGLKVTQKPVVRVHKGLCLIRPGIECTFWDYF